MSGASRLLVVEDDRALRRLLVDELEDAGHTVRAVASAEEGLAQLDDWAAELVISDVRLPGIDGLELLSRLQQRPQVPGLVLITAFGTVAQAVAALKAGADDFLTKPLDFDHLHLCLQRVLEGRRLRDEVARLRRSVGDDSFHGLLGSSPPMAVLRETIVQTARADGPVLVLGESGTGKELIARALHAESRRRDGPFVAVNCAGIPGELLESEFFGHAAGAFTGAAKARSGLFVEADGGTLLLDEIAEMPIQLQAKLLRLLQDGRVRPVGANRERRVDVRIIAATHGNLAEAMAAGRFREDLFYRLETFTVRVPPLRERDDDIELLAVRLVDQLAARAGRPARTLDGEALACLRRYPFPGNVRELRNALERAVAFCDGEVVGVDHLPERLRRGEVATATDQPSGDGLAALLPDQGPLPTLAELERRYIDHVLERAGGNKQRAAALLGIGRKTLYRKLSL